jgi:hypothetical protein
MKSQWKIIEPARFEIQYYSNNADDTGEYRICRIDVVVVVNKVEKERTAVMEDACCCSLVRRVDFDFRTLEKRSGFRAGWTPNFGWLGSGWRISILPSVLCVLSNEHYYLTHCLYSVYCLLVSPSCWSDAFVYASCIIQMVQGLHGNDGSRSSWRSRPSQ